MDISKEEFVKITTQGYPIVLNHPIDDFYDMFVNFVNESKENNFFAEVDDGVILHAGMRTEVCKMVYDGEKVIILSQINDDDETSSTGEFSCEEEFQILGHACIGVIYFCDLYALATGQTSKLSSDAGSNKPATQNNNYDVWPVG